MENRNNRYWKHLTLQDRYDIEDGLNNSHTLPRIADLLEKDKRDYFKRIRKHRIGDTLRVSGSNDCMNKYRWSNPASLSGLCSGY